MSRFIRVLQKDIVTKPEQWKDAGPGRFIKLSNKAKNVYSVLSVIAFSTAGNAKGKIAKNVGKLREGWFWTSHSILQQLTGSCQKTVQRAIKELEVAGFIGYHPAKKNGHQCFFKITRIGYNGNPDFASDGHSKAKTMGHGRQKVPSKTSTRRIDRDEKGAAQGKRDKREMLDHKKERFFQRGKDTHDEDGHPLDIKGKGVCPDCLSDAEKAFEEFGEMAFFAAVEARNIENHLVQDLREKFEKLKAEKKIISDPKWSEYVLDDIPF
jgi:hypothetical protein